jgi:hypothetical protein
MSHLDRFLPLWQHRADPAYVGGFLLALGVLTAVGVMLRRPR